MVKKELSNYAIHVFHSEGTYTCLNTIHLGQNHNNFIVAKGFLRFFYMASTYLLNKTPTLLNKYLLFAL